MDAIVGENRFTKIMLDCGGLVSETPLPYNIISVQPQDVVGDYTFSRGESETLEMKEYYWTVA